jgi:hypothetical protein
MSTDLHHLLTALHRGPQIFTAQQIARDPFLLRTIRRAWACGLITRPASLHPAAYESGQSDGNLSRGVSIQGLTAKGAQYLETVPSESRAAGTMDAIAPESAPARPAAAAPH